MLRDEKSQTYQLLLDLWTTVLVQKRAPTPLLQADLVREGGRRSTAGRIWQRPCDPGTMALRRLTIWAARVPM